MKIRQFWRDLHGYKYDISDKSNPVLVWQIEMPIEIRSITLTDENELFVGVQEPDADYIHLLDLDTGETLWKSSTAYEMTGSLGDVSYEGWIRAAKADAKYLYTISHQTIQAYSKDTGQRVWITDWLWDECPGDGVVIVEDMEMSEDSLFISPDDGSCVLSISKKNGAVNWSRSSSISPDNYYTFGGKPAYHNGVVYASNGVLWAFDAKTGEVLSITNNLDAFSLSTWVQYAADKIIVWGTRITAYKPVR